MPILYQAWLESWDTAGRESQRLSSLMEAALWGGGYTIQNKPSKQATQCQVVACKMKKPGHVTRGAEELLYTVWWEGPVGGGDI